ncbi:MAG: GntR family transcriptional regulator [Firmicutes bacterium HGW-Firmicutes-12]|nr:MAG: GntR family transcriptional regulator [Firmicutes bacterium HGW-Firmicutes-12]
MFLNFEDERPIFAQIAEEIENGILSGAFPEDSQIPSTTEISVRYKINPATVLKGMNLLVDSNIIYKKRGIGMFVAQDAKSKLMQKRKDQFYENFIVRVIDEANKLRLPKEEVQYMLERGFNR